MTDAPSFPSLVQYFFAQHLCTNKQVSPKTVAAYRDTFRLLLSFMQGQTGRPASALRITDLDAPSVLARARQALVFLSRVLSAVPP